MQYRTAVFPPARMFTSVQRGKRAPVQEFLIRNAGFFPGIFYFQKSESFQSRRVMVMH